MKDPLINRLDSLTIKRDQFCNMPFLNCGDLDERKQIKRNLF